MYHRARRWRIRLGLAHEAAQRTRVPADDVTVLEEHANTENNAALGKLPAASSVPVNPAVPVVI